MPTPKIPLALSTPVPIDYDNTYMGQLFTTVENPDSMGYENGRWYQFKDAKGFSPKKFDPYGIGIGLDVRYNNYLQNFPYHVDSKGRKYLTEEEERNIRHHNMYNAEQYLNNALASSGITATPDPIKKATTISYMLNRGSEKVKPLLNNDSVMDSFVNGTPLEYSQKVNGYFAPSIRGTRGKNTNTWVQETSSRRERMSEAYRNKRAEIARKLAAVTPIPYTPSTGSGISGYVQGLKNKYGLKAEGGPLNNSTWDSLSLKEKNDVIKVAIKNGLTTIPEIKAKYNELNSFDNGGSINKDWEDWKTAVKLAKGIDVDKDNTYDYRSFYEDSPEQAWQIITQPKEAHFTDKYKTVYHPTFSTESTYSGKYHPIHNPNKLVGGEWRGKEFIMSPDGYRGPVSMDDRLDYLEMAEPNGVVLRESNGKLPRYSNIFDNTMFGGVLPEATVTPNSKNMYPNGGYKPSSSIKKRISNWEGKAMTEYTYDPNLGRVVAPNASFDTVARDFVNVIPRSIRNQVLGNQNLADYLYSYAYNVGPGNFKKRVVPALMNYYSGKGSAEDVAESMWATGDRKKNLSGLRKRRAVERNGVRMALGLKPKQYTNADFGLRSNTKIPIVIPSQEELGAVYPAFVPSNPQAFFNPELLNSQQVEVKLDNPLVDNVEAYAEELQRQEALEKRQNANNLLGMLLGGSGLGASPFTALANSDSPLVSLASMMQNSSNKNSNPFDYTANLFAIGGPTKPFGFTSYTDLPSLSYIDLDVKMPSPAETRYLRENVWGSNPEYWYKDRPYGWTREPSGGRRFLSAEEVARQESMFNLNPGSKPWWSEEYGSWVNFNPKTNTVWKVERENDIKEAPVVTVSDEWKRNNPIKWKDISKRLFIDKEKEKDISDTKPDLETLNAITGGTEGKLAALGVGLLTPAAMAALGAAGSAATTALKPGGTFWTNPLTQGMAYGTLGYEGVNTGSKFITGRTWDENMSRGIQDFTGLNPSNSWYGQLGVSFLNPGGYLSPVKFDGLASGINDAAKSVLGSAKNSLYSSNLYRNVYSPYMFSRAMDKSVSKTTLQEPTTIFDFKKPILNPETLRFNPSINNPKFLRVKLGDIEINNPNLYYRQGSTQMGENFLTTGVVKTDDAGFVNPMYLQGGLWYGVPNKFTLMDRSGGTQILTSKRGHTFDYSPRRNRVVPKTDLLVSSPSVEMTPANSSSSPVSWVVEKEPSIISEKLAKISPPGFEDFIKEYNEAYFAGKLGDVKHLAINTESRRIPMTEGAANSSNTTLYRFDPNYGYRKLGNKRNYNFALNPFETPIIDNDGNLTRTPFSLMREVYKKFPFAAKASQIENRGYRGSTNLAEHISDVAKSAMEYPLPENVSRQDFVSAALYHDLGKLINSSSSHGHTSNYMIDQLGWRTNQDIIDAVANHMNGQKFFDNLAPSANPLIKALHAADVGRGMPYEKLVGKYPYLEYSYPKITTENAASVTPEQWTAAQDAAIARGDWTEAQRLRDLHGEIYGYKIRGSHASKVSDDFTEFNTGLKIKGTNKTPTIYNDSRNVTAGAFFGDNSNGVINQFGKPRDFLLKIDNPLQVDAYGMRYNRLLPPGTTKEDIIKAVNNLKAKGYTEEQIDTWIEGQFTSNADEYALKVYNSSVNDGAIIKNIYEGRMNPAYMENAVPTTDYIITKPSQAKSANAVTFDDNGVRIPLGLRDNFKLNDIRYGILPFIGLWVPAFRQDDKH